MTERKDRLDGLAVVLLLACCALWGVSQVAMKAALAELPPLTQSALRSAGAALLLWGWSGARGIAPWQRDGTLRGGLLAGVTLLDEPITPRLLLALAAVSCGIALVNRVGRRA